MLRAPVIAEKTRPVTLAGCVRRIDMRPDGPRVLIVPRQIDGFAPGTLPRELRIKLWHAALAGEGAANLRPGACVRFRAALVPPPRPALPGGYDFQRRSFFQGIGGYGFALSLPEAAPEIAPSGPGFQLQARVEALRRAVFQEVTQELDGATGAIAVALLTGDRSAIPPDVMQAVRDSGLAHLLAISGLHVGLVAGILFFAARATMAAMPSLALRHPIKKYAALIGFLGAAFYLILSGATIPTQRAVIMLGLVMIAVAVDREAISMRIVAWAAALILIFAPESLMEAGFQMSFAAVIALVAAYEALYRDRGWRRSMQRRAQESANPLLRVALFVGIYLAGTALTTLVASLATSPFAAFHFNRVAAFGLVANLIAVPLTALWIMPFGVVALALMPFGLASVALGPMGWGIDAVIGTATAIAAWPMAAFSHPAMPPASFVLLVIGGLWLCLWRTRWRLYGLGAIGLGLAILPVAPQGPDILVTGDGRTFMVRSADGAAFVSPGRENDFERTAWARHFGHESSRIRTFPEPGAGALDLVLARLGSARLACDSLACVLRTADGSEVSLGAGWAALAEDCGRAARLVIAAVPDTGRCGGVRLIDRFDLWRNGGHAVWLSPQAIGIETVAERQGDRPWRVRPGAD